MKRISILNQQDSRLLFSAEDYGVYFLMPLEDLKKLSELSYEWFEEYLPTVAVLLILSACLQMEVCAIGRMPFKFTNHGFVFFLFYVILFYNTTAGPFFTLLDAAVLYDQYCKRVRT